MVIHHHRQQKIQNLQRLHPLRLLKKQSRQNLQQKLSLVGASHLTVYLPTNVSLHYASTFLRNVSGFRRQDNIQLCCCIFCLIFLISTVLPLFSSRQQLGCNACGEVERKDSQICFVLFCDMHRNELFLNFSIGFLGLAFIFSVYL